jgi:hypothetical protein
MENKRSILIQSLCNELWTDEPDRIEYNYNKDAFIEALNRCNMDLLESMAKDLNIYIKGKKSYQIDTRHSDNRWYLIFTVYEITNNGQKLFKGKYKAMSIDDVIKEL